MLAGWLAEFMFHPHFIFKSCDLCLEDIGIGVFWLHCAA